MTGRKTKCSKPFFCSHDALPGLAVCSWHATPDEVTCLVERLAREVDDTRATMRVIADALGITTAGLGLSPAEITERVSGAVGMLLRRQASRPHKVVTGYTVGTSGNIRLGVLGHATNALISISKRNNVYVFAVASDARAAWSECWGGYPTAPPPVVRRVVRMEP